MDTQKNKYTAMEEDKKSIDYSVTKDGVTKSFRIREAIGGWIVNVCKDYQDEEGNYKYESKEYVTTSDPSEFIKNKESKVNDDDMISNMFQSLLNT